MSARFCSNCGKELLPGAKFCIKCGAQVAAVNAESTVNPAPAEENPVPAEEMAPVVPETIQVETAPVPETPAAPENTEVPPAPENRVVYAVPVSPVVEKKAEAGSYDDRVREYHERRQQYADKNYTPAPAVAPAQAQTKDNAPKRKMPGWAKGLIIAGSIILVIALFVIFILSATRAIKDLSKIASSVFENNEIREIIDKQIGDTTVPGDSNVTINITGDSETLAQAVYAKCADSVVGIAIVSETSSNPWAESTSTIVSEGSGVVYSSEGYIITNCHVVSNALDSNNKLMSGYSVRVYTDSSLAKYYSAAIVGVDYTSDLAVLKINANGLKPVEVATSKDVKVGDRVFVIGCPGGIEFMGSITSGIVGGTNKNLLTNGGYAYDLIQSDAAINPGNSGGAMLNNEGKLIGICEMKIVESGYEGMGFAIASDTVKDVCDTLIRDGKVVRPAIGLKVNTNYDVINASDAGLPAGAWIAEVEADSAAGKAGLQSGMIITKFNGVAVYNFVSLRAEIMKCQIGDEVTIEAYVYDSTDKTNGTYKTFKLNLSSLEDEHREFE